MLLDQIVESCLRLLSFKDTVASEEKNLMKMSIIDDVWIVDDGIDEPTEDLILN